MRDVIDRLRRSIYVVRALPFRPLGGLLLIVAIAVPSGVALGTAIGARRANHALGHLLRSYQPEDAGVYAQTSPEQAGSVLDAVGRLPGVVAIYRESLTVMGFRLPSGIYHAAVVNVALDPPTPGLIRPYVLAGRLPDPNRADEVAINRFLAQQLRVGVGSTIPARLFSADQIDDAGSGKPVVGKAGTAELKVTGIVHRPQDLESQGVDTPGIFQLNKGYMSLTPAFWKARGPALASYGVVSFLRVRGPATRVVAEAAAAKLPVGVIPVDQTFKDEASVRRSTHIESGALWIVAGLIALVAAVLIGPALRRWVAVPPGDEQALRAIGMTQRGLTAIEVLRALPVLTVGAGLSIPLGALIGSRAAFGTSKLAELTTTGEWPLTVLAVGVVVVVAVGLLAVAIPRLLRHRTSTTGRDASGDVGRWFAPSLGRLAATGAPPAVLAGARLAAPSGGRASTATRSAVLTVAAGVMLLVAALTFSASMSHLVATPRLRGWNWDYEVGNLSEQASVPGTVRQLRNDPDLEASTGWNSATLKVGDGRLDAVGLDDVAVSQLPVFSGRLPSRPGEIALTPRSLDKLDLRLGDRLVVTGDSARSFVVVGTTLGPGSISPEEQLGSGAIMTFADLAPMQPDLVTTSFLVRFRPGVDRVAATARLRRLFPETVVGPFATGEITTLKHAEPLPLLLAGVVAVLAAGSLVYAAASALRRRRREVAVLKALGFARGQLRIASLVQAVLLASAATVVGLPLGVVLGRWMWILAARTIGVVVTPVVPALTVTVVVLSALGIALIVGASSSRQVTRVSAATILRPE